MSASEQDGVWGFAIDGRVMLLTEANAAERRRLFEAAVQDNGRRFDEAQQAYEVQAACDVDPSTIEYWPRRRR